MGAVIYKIDHIVSGIKNIMVLENKQLGRPISSNRNQEMDSLCMIKLLSQISVEKLNYKGNSIGIGEPPSMFHNMQHEKGRVDKVSKVKPIIIEIKGGRILFKLRVGKSFLPDTKLKRCKDL